MCIYWYDCGLCLDKILYIFLSCVWCFLFQYVVYSSLDPLSVFSSTVFLKESGISLFKNCVYLVLAVRWLLRTGSLWLWRGGVSSLWRGDVSSCGVGASRCSGFSCCGAQAVAEGFPAQRHVGFSWIRGRVRCPALAGVFLTSGPPGKSFFVLILLEGWYCCVSFRCTMKWFSYTAKQFNNTWVYTFSNCFPI